MNAELFPRFPYVARCENSKSLLHIVHTSDLKILFLLSPAFINTCLLTSSKSTKAFSSFFENN